MEKRMEKEELLSLIKSLKIDKNEFYILSSSALMLRGIYKDAGDLDIAVSKKGLEELNKNYSLKQKENGWYIVNEKVECIVDENGLKNAEQVEGFNVQNINEYYNYLINSEREKDKHRVPIVEEYIKSRCR